MKVCSYCHIALTESESVCPRDEEPSSEIQLDPIHKELEERFHSITFFGCGSVGALYSAIDSSSQQRGLLKIIKLSSADAAVRARIKRELAKQTDFSNHVVPIIASGESGEDSSTGKALWLFRQWIEGESLAIYLKRIGRLKIPDAIAVAAQIAKGLDVIHHAGLLHRDLKPGHVILSPHSSGVLQAVLLDTGFPARIETQAPFDLAGTPKYISPEQIAGKPSTFRSDLYALGCVLFEMLTGKPPFTDKDPDALFKAHQKEPPPPVRLRGAPDPIRPLIASLLAKDPRERPFSAQQVYRTLEPFLPQSPLFKPSSNSLQSQAPQPIVTSQPSKTASGIVAPVSVPPPTPIAARRSTLSPPTAPALTSKSSLPPPPPRIMSSVPPPTTKIISSVPPPVPTSRSTTTAPPPPVPQLIKIQSDSTTNREPLSEAAPAKSADEGKAPIDEKAGFPVPEELDSSLFLEEIEESTSPSSEQPGAEQTNFSLSENLTANEDGVSDRDQSISTEKIGDEAPEQLATVSEKEISDEPETASESTVNGSPAHSNRPAVDFVVESLFDDEPSAGAARSEKISDESLTLQNDESDASYEIDAPPVPDPEGTARIRVPWRLDRRLSIGIAGGLVVSVVILLAIRLGESDSDETATVNSVPIAERSENDRKTAPKPEITPRVDAKKEVAAAANKPAIEEHLSKEAPADEAKSEESESEQSSSGSKSRSHKASSKKSERENESPSAEKLKTEAREHYAAGRYKSAVEAYEQVTKLSPFDAGAFAGLGASYLAINKTLQAINAYQQAILLQPNNSGFHAALGRAYTSKGDRTQAVASYQKALELNPDNRIASSALKQLTQK
jgi:serine/threonine protein kinase